MLSVRLSEAAFRTIREDEEYRKVVSRIKERTPRVLRSSVTVDAAVMNVIELVCVVERMVDSELPPTLLSAKQWV